MLGWGWGPSWSFPSMTAHVAHVSTVYWDMLPPAPGSSVGVGWLGFTALTLALASPLWVSHSGKVSWALRGMTAGPTLCSRKLGSLRAEFCSQFPSEAVTKSF